MSSKTWPEPVTVDPERTDIPEPLAAVLSRPAEERALLLLVAGDEAHASGWAQVLATTVADRLAEGGGRVVLADLGFHDPRLHRGLGAPDDEGMTDVFLFGASLKRVARSVEGHDFYFAPAGPYVGDVEELLDSDRWDRLRDGFRGADATLVGYLPAATPGAEALLGRVGHAIALGTSDDLDPIRRRGAGAEFHAVLVPPGAAVASEPASLALGELDAPDFVQRQPPPRSRRSVSPVLVALLVIVGLAALWFFFGQRLLEPASGTKSAPEQAAGVVQPRAVETLLPYSVAIESHQTLETALERTEALRRAQPGVEFYAAPVPVYGRVWFRVLAGPLADSASAAALLDQLVQAEVKSRAEDWDVRPTAWAYHLGEYETRSGAMRRVDNAVAVGVPAYVVPVDYTAGAPRYRVYAGAYETIEEAEAMASFLDGAGITGYDLHRRSGRAGG